MNNPYTLMFGKEPLQKVPRLQQMDEILSSFLSETPPSQVYIFTGIRGSGKTVSLSMAENEFRKRKDWVVIALNPETDLLKSLAAQLINNSEINSLLQRAKINISVFGFGAEISGQSQLTDYHTIIVKALEQLKRANKKLLVTIDEATNNEFIRIFAADFQIMVRQELPIFLLMTGLYENIDAIQNEKSLTFLYRAPKITMTPLSLNTIANNYSRELHVSDEEATAMAKITKGYPYAFQLLGYLCFERQETYTNVLFEFDQYLEEYVYDKIWAELSAVDRKIVSAIASSNTGKIAEIREVLGLETNYFNPYRKRLMKKGIVNGDERGYVRLTLPRFDRYCAMQSL